MTIRLR